jgi:hypothetical protein
MMGRSFIEFIAIGATASGIILVATLPSVLTIATGSILVLASIAALIRHYWVMTEPDAANLGIHE